MARLYQHDVFILIVSITVRLGSIFGLIVDLSPHFTTLLLCHCPLPWSPNIPLMPIPPRSRFRLRRQNRHNPVLFHLASEFMAAGDLPCVFSPPKIRGNNWRFWSQSPWFPLVKVQEGFIPEMPGRDTPYCVAYLYCVHQAARLCGCNVGEYIVTRLSNKDSTVTARTDSIQSTQFI